MFVIFDFVVVQKSANKPIEHFYFVEHGNLRFTYTNEIKENWYLRKIMNPQYPWLTNEILQ